MNHPISNLHNFTIEINALAQQLRNSLGTSQRNNVNQLISEFYSLVLDRYQRLIDIPQRRITAQNLHILQSLIDAAFATTSVIIRPSLVEGFYEPGNFRGGFLGRKQRSLTADLGHRLNLVSARQMAIKAGLFDYYANLNAILDQLRQTPPAQSSTPTPATQRLMCPACECLLLSIKSVSEHFSVTDLNRDISDYWVVFSNMSKSCSA